MNILDSYTRDVLIACKKFAVEFIIVGGYAVNFHGYRRTTGDIDIWIKPDNQNKLKVIEAFRSLGIGEEMLVRLNELDFSKHLVFSDGEEPFKIDFLTYISGVHYEEADKQKINAKIDDIEIPFLHLNHLVLSKTNTGRLKDQLDIEKLQQIAQQRKNR